MPNISCPHCKCKLTISESAADTVRCPICRKDFSVKSLGSLVTEIKSDAPTEIQAGLPATEGRDVDWFDDEDDAPERLEIGNAFKPASGLAAAVKVLFFLYVVFGFLFLGSGYLQYQLTERMLKRENIQQIELKDNDSRHRVLSVLNTAIFLLTAIVFLFWFHRSYANLEPLRARGLKYSRGWAVGCWFVPILSLFRPVMIAQEIWRQSDPEDVAERKHGAGGNSLLIGIWWAAWVVSLILGNISSYAILEAKGPENLQIATFYHMVSTGASIGAAALALLVVHEIDIRQTERAAALSLVARDS
jgi:hypothetical protein